MSLSLNATPKEKTQLIATQVEALDPYALMTVLGKRVIHPSGRRSTDEFILSRVKQGSSDELLPM